MARTSVSKQQTHEPSLRGVCTQGRVAQLDAKSGRGVIETTDGQALSFSVHEVIHGNFFEFEPGDEVRAEFTPSESSQRSHATSVWPVAKHHLTE